MSSQKVKKKNLESKVNKHENKRENKREKRTASVLQFFESDDDFYLCAEEGDLVTVINSKQADFWYVQDSDGRKGYLPSNILKELENSALSSVSKSRARNRGNQNREKLTINKRKGASKEDKIQLRRKEFNAEINDSSENDEIQPQETKIKPNSAESKNKRKTSLKLAKKEEKVEKMMKEFNFSDESEEEALEGARKDEVIDETLDLINRLQLGDALENNKVEQQEPKEEMLNNEEEQDTFECDICSETVATAECASVGCEHQFCRECMHGYIASRIGDNQLRDFKCPAPDCDRVADQATVELFLDADDFRKLQELQLRKMAGEIPELYYCPQPNCGQPIEVGDGCMAVCPCGFVFCTNCNQPYHGWQECGLTDEERKIQVELFEEEDAVVDKEEPDEKIFFRTDLEWAQHYARENGAYDQQMEADRRFIEQMLQEEAKLMEAELVGDISLAEEGENKDEKEEEEVGKKKMEKEKAKPVRNKVLKLFKRAEKEPKENKKAKNDADDLRKREAEKVKQEAENRRKEEKARRKVEADKRKKEADKLKAEADRLKAAEKAEKARKQEVERQRVDAERQRKAELARQQAEMNRKREEERERKRQEEAASENLIKHQFKKCPRCRNDIEKIDGCNRMRCKCGINFCWLCLRVLADNRDAAYGHFGEECQLWN